MSMREAERLNDGTERELAPEAWVDGIRTHLEHGAQVFGAIQGSPGVDSPEQDELPHAFGMLDREALRDRRPHRARHDHRRIERPGIQEGGDVVWGNRRVGTHRADVWRCRGHAWGPRAR